jgi:hypothetical protein
MNSGSRIFESTAKPCFGCRNSRSPARVGNARLQGAAHPDTHHRLGAQAAVELQRRLTKIAGLL